MAASQIGREFAVSTLCSDIRFRYDTTSSRVTDDQMEQLLSQSIAALAEIESLHDGDLTVTEFVQLYPSSGDIRADIVPGANDNGTEPYRLVRVVWGPNGVTPA